MKNSERLGFKKSSRDNFIHRFKTEVRESKSAESTRLSQIHHLNYKIYNSFSPHTKISHLPHKIMTSPKAQQTKQKEHDSSHSTAKIKIKLVSQRNNENTAVRCSYNNQSND